MATQAGLDGRDGGIGGTPADAAVNFEHLSESSVECVFWWTWWKCY